MRNYLQLLLFSLVISVLSLYLTGMAISGAFDAPVVKQINAQINQPMDVKNLSRQFMQRQKVIFQERQQEWRYTLRQQSQKIQSYLRGLKERIYNLGYY